MVTPKDYKVVSDRSLEHLVDTLKEHSKEGWSVVAYTQEYALTKILLEKEI